MTLHYYLNKARSAITREMRVNGESRPDRHAPMYSADFAMLQRVVAPLSHPDRQACLATFYAAYEI